jgi:PAS domain S-box-containing protein
MPKKPNNQLATDELRHRAEHELKGLRRPAVSRRTEANTNRLLHELQVHQIELQLQNAELQGARDRMETLLETYLDLYDFAPVGYFSVDEKGLILEVNLTGAALIGIERSRLINKPLRGFVDPQSMVTFASFLKKVFSISGKQVCELALLDRRGSLFWTDFQATLSSSLRDGQKWCRIAISDLTKIKQEEEVRRRLEIISEANLKLKREIAQRQKLEIALKTSEAHYAQLFEKSVHFQEQLRHLSHQILLTQEEERKRISRELHDEIIQTLVGINVHLASLTGKQGGGSKDLRRKIARTRRLMENSIEIVHRFARELRPTVLDDLGLIPALQSFISDFTKRTNIHTHFTAFSGVEQLDGIQRTVLYRVAQSALTNIHQHAKAREAEVTIRKLPGAIRLEIHDNGKSFEVNQVLFTKRHKRLGLLGSRERVEMIGGKFGIESAPGRGTTISAEIPITGNDPKKIANSNRRKKTPSNRDRKSPSGLVES